MSNPMAAVQTAVVSTLLTDGESAIAVIGQALLIAAVLMVLFFRVLRFISGKFGKDFTIHFNQNRRRKPPPFQFVFSPHRVAKTGTPVSLDVSEGFMKQSISMPVDTSADYHDDKAVHVHSEPSLEFDGRQDEYDTASLSETESDRIYHRMYNDPRSPYYGREGTEVLHHEGDFADTIIDWNLDQDDDKQAGDLLTGNANGKV